MKSENHWAYQDLKERSLSGSLGDEDAIAPALMYVLSQDKNYASLAYGCVQKGSNPSRNTTRHNFVTSMIVYDWIKTGISQDQQADFLSRMERWKDLCFGLIPDKPHFTRASDSDEQTGHYFGIALLACAEIGLRNDIFAFQGNSNHGNTTKSFGSFESTGRNWQTMRNMISVFMDKANGGQWVESGQYNLASCTYWLLGHMGVNLKIGKDMFPEITSAIKDFAKCAVAEITPDYKQNFQWGDTEQVNHLYLYRRIPYLALLAGMSKDPECLWMMDKMVEKNAGKRIPSSWFIYYDPYSPRKEPGDMAHNAEGVGISYFKKGDTLFVSMMKNRLGFDHDYNSMTTFKLYKNGWAIDHPDGYVNSLYRESQYKNDLLVFGMFPTVFQRERGQVDYQFGDDWVYHAGRARGQSGKNGTASPEEDLHEWTRQMVYLHDKAIVIFDRINCSDPKKSGTFGKYRSELQDLYSPYHQVLFHMPEGMVKNGDWYTVDNIKIKAYYDHQFEYKNAINIGLKDGEAKKVLILKPKETEKAVLLTIIDLGSDIISINGGTVNVDGRKINFNTSLDGQASFSING